MEVLEALRTRRTVHSYQESEIAPEVLKEALELALLAPNHKFTFPWKFVVVGSETRAKLFELNKYVKRKTDEPFTPEEEEKLEQKLRPKMLHPAALVVFCCAKNEDDFRQREDYATIACSIQNFTLALTGHGYGTKWSTGAITRAPETYKLLDVNPDAHEIVGFVWVGHGDAPLPPQKRPSLDEVLVHLP